MTVVRRALALVASAALSLSLAAPASASLAEWWLASVGVFPGRDRGGRRGPGRRSPGRQRPRTGPRQGCSQTARDLPRAAKGRAPSDFSVTVPVYWHVVTDGAAGTVTDSQITGQISAINRGFSGGEGGAVTGFTFSLAGVTRSNNAVWYRSRSPAPSTL